jgi:hypothetical protein
MAKVVERGEAVWFFTGWGSQKVHELLHDRRVSLGYADPKRPRNVRPNGASHESLQRTPTVRPPRSRRSFCGCTTRH